MKNMEPVKILAAAKAIKAAAEKQAKAELSPGSYPVDVKVRIRGQINVFEPEEYTPTTSIPLKSALALFIRRCGVTRDAALAALQDAMIDALRHAEGDADANIAAAISEDLEVVDDCLARVEAMAKALPKKQRDGKVTTKLTVEELVAV